MRGFLTSYPVSFQPFACVAALRSRFFLLKNRRKVESITYLIQLGFVKGYSKNTVIIDEYGLENLTTNNKRRRLLD